MWGDDVKQVTCKYCGFHLLMEEVYLDESYDRIYTTTEFRVPAANEEDEQVVDQCPGCGNWLDEYEVDESEREVGD